MNTHDILDMIGDARGEYLLQAQKYRTEEAHPRPLRPRRAFLIAAVIALMLLLVGCTIAYAKGWFPYFFSSKSNAPLTQEQISYIEENEQQINESKAQNGWTVELRSAINDGATGYIIIGITAPEGTNLEQRIANDRYLDRFTPGNGGIVGAMKHSQNIITPSAGVVWSQLAMSWEEDGDGLSHTKNYVIQIYPDMERSTADPFGPDAVYHIYMENIIREYDDEEYRQQLLDTKYKDQDAIMFTQEEIDRMSKVEVLVEGVWEFHVTFSSDTRSTELLTQPLTVQAMVTRSVQREDWLVSDNSHSYEEVTLTSVTLNPLSVVLHTAEDNVSFTFDEDLNQLQVYAVLKDGSRIELLPYGAQGVNFQTLEAASPLVLSEVDHILLADGTIIPVPAQ